MNTLDIINLTINPWDLLGVSIDADDREIETAWKNLSRGHRKNDTIRQAYQLIAKSEDRALYKLLSPHCVDNPGEILNSLPPSPKYSGPGIWNKTLGNHLKEQRRKLLAHFEEA